MADIEEAVKRVWGKIEEAKKKAEHVERDMGILMPFAEQILMTSLSSGKQ